MIEKYDQSFHMWNKVLTTIWALHTVAALTHLHDVSFIPILAD